MNNLIIKDINFYGSELTAIQEKDTQEIYTSINYVLRGLGFNDEQIRYQREKVMSDKVIKKGVRKFSHPSSNDGGIQETYCINIKKLPLALAKINITPKIQEETPELAEQLELYQDKCADVLAEAFLGKEKIKTSKTSLASVNNAVKIVGSYMKQAGIKEDIQLLTIKGLYAKADVYLPIDIEADKVYYDTEYIARQLGIYSKKGKPASTAVSQLIKKLDIFEDEVKEVWENVEGWQGVVKKYSQSVIEKAEEWIIENNYPSTIKGKSMNYHVIYEISV